MFTFESLVGYGRNAAAALGAGTALLSGYVALGMPVPASTGFVEAKIAVVSGKIDALDASTAKRSDTLTATMLELQRKTIVQTRARLRFEHQANAAMIPKADTVRRVTLERRSAEIQDELADLERDDAGLRARIERLRQP